MQYERSSALEGKRPIVTEGRKADQKLCHDDKKDKHLNHSTTCYQIKTLSKLFDLTEGGHVAGGSKY